MCTLPCSHGNAFRLMSALFVPLPKSHTHKSNDLMMPVYRIQRTRDFVQYRSVIEALRILGRTQENYPTTRFCAVKCHVCEFRRWRGGKLLCNQFRRQSRVTFAQKCQIGKQVYEFKVKRPNLFGTKDFTGNRGT